MIRQSPAFSRNGERISGIAVVSASPPAPAARQRLWQSDITRRFPMRRILIAAICSVLAACTTTPDRTPVASDEEPTLGEVQSEVLRCGIRCLAGEHVAAFLCDISCGPCDINRSQVDCRANSGSFLACGSCPAGWHSSSIAFTLSCNISVSIPTFDPNQSACDPNIGSFRTCGRCPAGWHVTSTGFNPACGATGPNENFCVPN